MVFKSQVYLFYGKALLSSEELMHEPNGLQDALTDPSTNKWFYIVNALLALNFFAIIYYLGLYGAILALVNYYVIFLIIKIIMPKPSGEKWARGIYKSLLRREADYEKDGDQMRSHAMRMLRDRFENKFMR
jgi:hypothetical protein